MRPVKRYELIELIVPAGNTALRIPFLDIPQLRSDVTQDIVVRGLETFTADSMAADFNAVPVVSSAQLQKCFLTLYIEQEQSYNFVPLIKLLNIATNQNLAGYFFNFEKLQSEDIMVDWTKSFITLSSSLGNVANVAIMLGVEYKRYDPGVVAAVRAKENQANVTAVDQYNNARIAGPRRY